MGKDQDEAYGDEYAERGLALHHDLREKARSMPEWLG
jgi:hypothetical protein